MAGYDAQSLVRVTSAPIAAGDVRSAYKYWTADAAATVAAAGYFNGARTRLLKGDTITVVSDVGGTPALKAYVVTASPSTGNVTIALQATT